MKLNTVKTKDGKYLLRNDIIPKGIVLPIQTDRNGALKRNDAASYLVEGRVLIMNPNRPDREHEPSRTRIDGDPVFPGKYKIKVVEKSKFCCLHLSNDLSGDDYLFEETTLNEGQTAKFSTSDDIEVLSVSIGSVYIDGIMTPQGSLIDVRDGDVFVKAAELTTITTIRVVRDPT